MLAQRRRRWVSISPALGQRLMFAGATSPASVGMIEAAGQTDKQNATERLSGQR